MASSFIEYKGHGFWSFDSYIEHLLALLAETVGEVPRQEWLNQARTHWLEQASGMFSGWIDPRLDDFINSEERVTTVLYLLDNVTRRQGVTWEVKQTVELLRSLLEGKLRTEVASPHREYMVQGPQPYKWRRD